MVKLLFYGSDKSETSEHSITCYCNIHHEIYIEISMGHNDFTRYCVCLDKETAIKLSKELRKQIAYIQDERVD
jgi:hypothetical protein